MADEENMREALQLATGKVIRELLKQREAAGNAPESTVLWLSAAAGIPTATLTRIVTGKTVITLHGLHAIGTALGTTLTELVRLVEETLAQAELFAKQQLGTGDRQGTPWWQVASAVSSTVLGGFVGVGAAMAVSRLISVQSTSGEKPETKKP